MVLLQWLVYRERKKNKYSPFTEKTLRSPGASLNRKHEDKLKASMESATSLAITPLAYMLLIDHLSSISAVIFTGITILAMLFMGYQFVYRAREAVSLKLGLDGEIYTGLELNYLMRDGAFVYHDVPYKYGNIDHVIVSTGGVFVVETKAIRKPSDSTGKRQSRVFCRNGHLQFPTFSTSSPLIQAARHAEHMQKFICNRLGDGIRAFPVVALPGWFVEENDNKGLLIINPKRGKALRSYIKRPILTETQMNNISSLIEEIVRSEEANAEKYNPDASEKFTFWLDRRADERKID